MHAEGYCLIGSMTLLCVVQVQPATLLQNFNSLCMAKLVNRRLHEAMHTN
jgi:hypothetical protein